MVTCPLCGRSQAYGPDETIYHHVVCYTAQAAGCPVQIVDADSEAVARDWLVERGWLDV